MKEYIEERAVEIANYICSTDFVAAKSDRSRAADEIKNWLRNRNTLDFWVHGS